MMWDGKRVWFTYAFKIFLSSEFSFAASVESLSSTLNCWPILYDHDDDLFFPAIMIMNSLFLYTSPYKLLTQMRIRNLHDLTVSMKHQLLQLSKPHLPPSLDSHGSLNMELHMICYHISWLYEIVLSMPPLRLEIKYVNCNKLI